MSPIRNSSNFILFEEWTKIFDRCRSVNVKCFQQTGSKDFVIESTSVCVLHTDKQQATDKTSLSQLPHVPIIN